MPKRPVTGDKTLIRIYLFWSKENVSAFWPITPGPAHRGKAGVGGHRDTCPGLTVSFSAQSVEGLTLVANQVLHVAIFNLGGLWDTDLCKEKVIGGGG